jgi:tRNA-modifying protein YgfZ
VLHVTGEDALAFLQGQFTHDLRRTAPAALSVYGLWLNQKGRILADSHVLRVSPHDAWIFASEASAVAIRERLEAYVIADDVVIEDQTSQWSGLVIAGAAGCAWLANRGATLPTPNEFTRTPTGGFVFPGRRAAVDTWELVEPADIPVEAGVPLVPPDAIERARISAALPAIPRDLGETDLPNEGGLEDVAVSYTKGCYLGQEVMARLKAMGRVRRRLARVAGAGAPPPPRAPLYHGDKSVGDVRSAIHDGEGGWIGLAMMMLLGLDPAKPLALSPTEPATVTLCVEDLSP